MEYVDVETYRSWSSHARTEFDLWLRINTGLEVGLVHCWEVEWDGETITTYHWLNFGEGIASRDDRPIWFSQTYDRAEKEWRKTPHIVFSSET